MSQPDTPFTQALASSAAQLPGVFRVQFLLAPEESERTLLEGEMLRVWIGHRWMRPIFAVLGRLGILVGQMGEHIPTTLLITASRGSQGEPRQAYDRTLRFASPAHFNTIMAYVPDAGRAAEYFGPGHRLFMLWEIDFHALDRLTMQTAAFGVRLFGRHWSLPRGLGRWLGGAADFEQLALADPPDCTRINLIMRHPLFGSVFGYEGVFHVRRIPDPAVPEEQSYEPSPAA